jgi:probable phosphoglycerate mutase
MIHRFELVAVRHGRTAWNADGRFQGHTDNSLDEYGRAQARAIGAALARDRFAVAVTSDLVRAKETAELILGARGPTLEPDERLREMRFGAWEGLTWAEIVARDPTRLEISPTKPGILTEYTPEGGESFDELCGRVADAFGALDARVWDGAKVLLTTHAGPLHALLRVALGEADANALAVRFSPASITRFALAPEGSRIVELNVTLPHVAAS